MPSQYTVKPGDSWASIAGALYGNQRWLQELANANGGIGRMLHPGDVVNGPDFDLSQTPVITPGQWSAITGNQGGGGPAVPTTYGGPQTPDFNTNRPGSNKNGYNTYGTRRSATQKDDIYQPVYANRKQKDDLAFPTVQRQYSPDRPTRDPNYIPGPAGGAGASSSPYSRYGQPVSQWGNQKSPGGGVLYPSNQTTIGPTIPNQVGTSEFARYANPLMRPLGAPLDLPSSQYGSQYARYTNPLGTQAPYRDPRLNQGPRYNPPPSKNGHYVLDRATGQSVWEAGKPNGGAHGPGPQDPLRPLNPFEISTGAMHLGEAIAYALNIGDPSKLPPLLNDQIWQAMDYPHDQFKSLDEFLTAIGYRMADDGTWRRYQPKVAQGYGGGGYGGGDDSSGGFDFGGYGGYSGGGYPSSARAGSGSQFGLVNWRISG